MSAADTVANDMRLLAQISRRLEGLSRAGKSYLFDQLATELVDEVDTEVTWTTFDGPNPHTEESTDAP